MLKSSTESCREEISHLFKDLNQSSYRLLLPLKQFLFDQLANLYLEQPNRATLDCWERVHKLLSFIVECVVEDNNPLEEYQLPYHPSITVNNNQRSLLLDLFFFYLERCFNDETIRCEFVTKIMQSALQNTRHRHPIIATKIFNTLKTYFLLRSTALLLCETNVSPDDQRSINGILRTIISTYLLINREATQLNEHLHIFLSTIISKCSWNFLFNLLKSDHIQRLNTQWATTLCNLLQTRQTGHHNEYLQLCHQIQFTLSINNTSSIFPEFHQSYEQL
jgi:hypothetical protein